jgi:hypothetical protein
MPGRRRRPSLRYGDAKLVALTGAASGGGAVVTLTSSNTAVAIVPASVTVTFNCTTATFTMSIRGVTSRKTPSISATYRGTTKRVALTVTH